MRSHTRFLFAALLLLSAAGSRAQEPGLGRIAEAIERDGCVVLESGRVRVCKYDYTSSGLTVEAVSFRPAKAPSPASCSSPATSAPP